MSVLSAIFGSRVYRGCDGLITSKNVNMEEMRTRAPLGVWCDVHAQPMITSEATIKSYSDGLFKVVYRQLIPGGYSDLGTGIPFWSNTC